MATATDAQSAAGEQAKPEEAAPTEEPAMIEIWRPGGQGRQYRPNRPAQQARSGDAPDNRGRRPKARPNGGKGKGGQAGHGKPRHDGKAGQAARKPPRERPIDPNSPFAALAALKSNLENPDKS